MLRKLFVLSVGAMLIALVSGVSAQDKKKDEKKTLEGSLVCTKCELKETDKCGHCLLVKEKDKEIKYYLADKGGKEPYHGDVCQAPKAAKVTGMIVEKKEKDMVKKIIEKPEVKFKD